jgi:hypothetical protein
VDLNGLGQRVGGSVQNAVQCSCPLPRLSQLGLYRTDSRQMPTPNLQRAMAAHRDAVYARDVPTFMALSNDQVRVFGL